MRRSGRIIAVLFAAAIFPLIWFYFLTPIHLTLKHHAKATVTIDAEGDKRVAQRYSRLSDFIIEIVNSSKDGQVVELALPIPDGASRLKLEQFEVVTGDWVITHNGERVESRIPGSRLVFLLRSREPELPFLQRIDGGSVLVSTSDGFKSALDLRGDTYKFRTLTIPAREVNTVSFAGTLATISELTVTVTDATADSSILVTLGGGRLLRNATMGLDDSAYKLNLNLREKVTLISEAAMNLWVPIGLAALLILIFTTIGRTLLYPSLSANKYSVNPLLAFATGLAAFALLGNTLSYFFSADDIAPVVYGLFFLAAARAVYFILRSKSIDYFGYSALSKEGVVAGLCGVWFGFWPVMFAGSSYLGFLQTDSFFYTNVANALQHNSLFDLIEKGGLIGYGLRSIDLTLAALLASVGGLTPSIIWLTLCALFMFLPAVFSYELVLKWRGRRAAMMTAWAVAMSAPLGSLFFEAYFAQFLLIGLLYVNLHAGWFFYKGSTTNSLNWESALPFILTTATIMLLYPYFAVLPFITALVVVFYAIQYGKIWRILLCAGGVVLFSNIGIYFLFNHGATESFTPALNVIAQYVVFPFYNEWKFPSFIFGFTPFHGTGEIFMNIATEFDSFLLSRIAAYVHTTETVYAGVLIGAVGVLYIYALWCGRRYFFAGFGLILPVSLVGYLLLMVVAYWVSGLYAYAKLAWTLAALLPVIIVPTILFVAVNKKDKEMRLIGVFGLTVVCMLITANAVSKLSATVLWVANPYGIVMGHVNTAVAGHMLQFLDSSITNNAFEETRTFAFHSEPPMDRLDQKSQVFAAHIYSSMSSRGYYCVNCVLSEKLLDFRGFNALSKSEIANVGVVIRIDDKVQ